MQIHVTSKYLHDQAIVRLDEYDDGTPAIRLMTPDGKPLATPTVNMLAYGIVPLPGNVIIKDYQENEGILQALQDAGVVGEIIKSYDAGFVKKGVHEVPLLITE